MRTGRYPARQATSKKEGLSQQNKMKKLAIFLWSVLALSSSPMSFAHSDAELDQQAAPHQGQIRMAGAYHIELVAKNNALTAYITDHAGQNVDTKGATASAILLNKAQKTTVTLSPANQNTLKGAGQFAISPETKIVMTLQMAGQPAVQARFTPLAPKHAAGMPHSH